MRLLIILFLFSIFQNLSAEEYELSETALHVDARDLALGGLVSSLDVMSNNTLECTYLMPYQLKELSIRKLSFFKRTLGLEWNVGWYQSGNEDWMENAMKLHCGKQLNENLFVGIEADVLLVYDILERSHSTCFAQLDCHYALTEKITIGLALLNPNGACINTTLGKVPLSSAAYLAARFNPAKKCQLYCETGVWMNKQSKSRLGIEYVIDEALIIRTGLSTGPLMPSWGIGGSIKRFHYSWGGNQHPILGMTNGFSLNFSW